MPIKIFFISLFFTVVIFIAYFFYNSPATFLSANVLGSNSGGQSITTTAPDGYSYLKIKTNSGSFWAHVYKANLSKITVKTVAANKETCKNNCPTKALKQYAQENNAVAAMNGSYFCPPDYANCKGKTNSYDFAFYNSNKKTWINKGSLSWNKTAMVLFKGSSVQFCMDTTKCSKSGVTAALSNYPALVQDSRIVVDKGDVQPYQKNKGTKGIIGTDGKYIYLVLVQNVTIYEEANVARALGMTSALNIDGGGSSAMYVNGAYKAGPGRMLPNAIVIVK